MEINIKFKAKCLDTSRLLQSKFQNTELTSLTSLTSLTNLTLGVAVTIIVARVLSREIKQALMLNAFWQ